MIVVLHNNGCTGIDQPNIYLRGLKMTKQKQMTERELTRNVELSDEELDGMAGGWRIRSTLRRAEDFSKSMLIINRILGMAG